MELEYKANEDERQRVQQKVMLEDKMNVTKKNAFFYSSLLHVMIMMMMHEHRRVRAFM